MERAATALTGRIVELYGVNSPFVVFAGPGNNGGDALAVARMLAARGASCEVFLFNVGGKLSQDCAANMKQLQEAKHGVKFTEVRQEFDPPQLTAATVVIDGLFGSGLNKPLAGGFASLVKYINASVAHVVSIDVPSGLMTEDNTFNRRVGIVQAELTLTLGGRKLAFLFAEHQRFVGRVEVLDIGLSKEGLAAAESRYYAVEPADVRRRMKPRSPFAHKGDMGSALLVAGSYGMCGAAVLAARACLRSGVGKVVVACPTMNVGVMQMSVPEAVVSVDDDERMFTTPVDTADFTALAMGPGLGTTEQTAVAMIAQLRRAGVPAVLDADALNVLANHRAWLQQLPKSTILTPHPKEFDRMYGASTNSYERLSKASDVAQRSGIYIILKGHYSALCLPDGHVLFNTTGNDGMATAGSGDVLTGVIAALLARGYRPEDAAVAGMYIHGLAGDIAAAGLGADSLIAGDIVACLPQAFIKLLRNEQSE